MSSQSVNGRFCTEIKPLTSRHSVWPPCHIVLTGGMHLSLMPVNESFDWSWYPLLSMNRHQGWQVNPHSLTTTPTHLAGGQVNQHWPCWGTGEPALTLLGDRWTSTDLAGGQVNQHSPCWGTGEPALTLLGDRWTSTHLAGGQVNQHSPCWGTGEPALTLLGDRWTSTHLAGGQVKLFLQQLLELLQLQVTWAVDISRGKGMLQCLQCVDVDLLLNLTTHAAIRSIHRDLSWMSPRRTSGINLCTRHRKIC